MGYIPVRCCSAVCHGWNDSAGGENRKMHEACDDFGCSMPYAFASFANRKLQRRFEGSYLSAGRNRQRSFAPCGGTECRGNKSIGELCDSLRLGAYRKVEFEAPDEAPHVDGRFVTDITKSVDTLYIGRYTFKGTPESYIYIQSNVGRQETDEYNNTVCLSQIRIIPVKEDE